jgi:hypothetical protein
LPAAPSRVAEKNSVWRSDGIWATIRSTGLKPMSSMGSASSRTRIEIALRRPKAPGIPKTETHLPWRRPAGEICFAGTVEITLPSRQLGH